VFTISATAAPSPTGTARIKKWCLTIDGNPATTDSATSSSMVDSYGTFDSDTGCWSSFSQNLTSAKFSFNSTAWPNGAQTYQVTITDTSNRIATSSILTINHTNTIPSVAWTTTNNSNVSGQFSISAIATPAPTGTATIKKWCLTINGTPETTDSATSSSMVDSYGTFDSDTGCWSSFSQNLTSAKFSFNSTAWPNGAQTYQVTVTDTSNRTATSTILTINRVAAQAAPVATSTTAAVAWATSNNSTVSGFFTVSATAVASLSTAATIKKWCLTINGSPATTNSAVHSYSSSQVGYSGLFNADTGCWTSSYYNLTSAWFNFDSTDWTNGSVTYQVTVTDTSNRSATSTILTVNHNNTPPAVVWTTSNNSSASGAYTISATAGGSPTGTATIKKWCLTINGSPATTNSAVHSYSSSQVGYSGLFNADTGCWTSSYYNLTNAWFSFDSTAWTNRTVTYQVTVTDTSNRTATSTDLVVTTNNPQPTASLSGVGGGVSIQSSAGITASIYHPGADSIRTWCFKVSNGPCISGTSQSNGTSRTNGILRLDVSSWVNGSYSLTASAVDSIGRTITTSPSTFVVNNPPASVTKPRISHRKPTWNSRTTTASVSTTMSNVSSSIWYWGTSTKSMKKWSGATNEDGEWVYTIRNLKPNTWYYFKITAIGPNGTSTTSIVKSKTGKIPTRPKTYPSNNDKKLG
jgi:hypothetical protein